MLRYNFIKNCWEYSAQLRGGKTTIWACVSVEMARHLTDQGVIVDPWATVS